MSNNTPIDPRTLFDVVEKIGEGYNFFNIKK